MRDLILPVKRMYFEQIQGGTKKAEYRLTTGFWRKRIEGRTFDRVVITLGYPKRDDKARRLEFPWRGYSIETITHPHFGGMPVEVFAIAVGGARYVPKDDDGEPDGDEAVFAHYGL
jgi:hypothetical protein